MLGHAARTPMRGILRSAFQGPYNDRLDTDILNRARRAGARLVTQPIHPSLDKTSAPFANRSFGDTQAVCNLLVLQTTGAFKNNPRPKCQALRRLASRRKQFELCPLGFAENQFRHPPSHSHSPWCSRTTLAHPRESVMTRTSESGH
jgi:hypothetical protein